MTIKWLKSTYEHKPKFITNPENVTFQIVFVGQLLIQPVDSGGQTPEWFHAWLTPVSWQGQWVWKPPGCVDTVCWPVTTQMRRLYISLCWESTLGARALLSFCLFPWSRPACWLSSTFKEIWTEFDCLGHIMCISPAPPSPHRLPPTLRNMACGHTAESTNIRRLVEKRLKDNSQCYIYTDTCGLKDNSQLHTHACMHAHTHTHTHTHTHSFSLSVIHVVELGVFWHTSERNRHGKIIRKEIRRSFTVT